MRDTRVHGVGIEPKPGDRDVLKLLADALARVPSHTEFCLSGPDTKPIELPESLYLALKNAVTIMSEGAAVVISPLHRQLSTTEAGDVLGVSRQYLTRLLDRGALPCRLVGRHRRLKLSDVLAYKAAREAKRIAFVDSLTADSEEDGEYA